VKGVVLLAPHNFACLPCYYWVSQIKHYGVKDMHHVLSKSVIFSKFKLGDIQTPWWSRNPTCFVLSWKVG